MWWAVVSLVMLWSSAIGAVEVSCKNENGVEVDWYILYKAPNGARYIYIDTDTLNTADRVRVLGEIGDPSGVLANTLSPMLRSVRDMFQTPTFGFLSYSDQPPGSAANSNSFGHSKGVVLGDTSDGSALWLTHSTPQFPFRRDKKNFYPPSGKTRGQTFMCVSLDFTQLNIIGKHLQRIQAFPFDYDLPNNFPEELKDVTNWDQENKGLGDFQILTTKGKTELKLMAKKIAKPPKGATAKAADGDLYVQLAQEFKSDVDAQTYGCQSGADENYCEPKIGKVINVKLIEITQLGKWDPNQDHSKWAVTTNNNIHWTCISDVNRSPSQYERWGGAVCIEHETINKIFRESVSETYECGVGRKRHCDDSDNHVMAKKSKKS